MTKTWILLIALSLLASATTAARAGDDDPDPAMQAALRALDAEDDAGVARAVAALRALGPRSLPAARAHLRRALEARAADGAPTDAALRARRIYDRIAGQKDAVHADLFWHTDLGTAEAAARETGRPILSLRLLGRLDEDLSCANSRYFRTALYANRDLAAHLRDAYVLHWQSVRPVPVITIDFGDGRKVCRTITGNSIHYVLDAEGRVVDGLPGLYGPAAFRAALDRAAAIERRLRGMPEATRADALALWHAGEARRLEASFLADLGRVGDGRATVDPTARARGPEAPRAAPPTAREAAPIARGKSIGEMPVLRAMQPRADLLVPSTPDATWARIADLHAALATLDAGSLALMHEKLGRRGGPAFDAVVASFTRAMREDTVRNEYDLHRRLHGWLAASTPTAVDDLNERVYAQLFLTPSSDPWLGLVPADAYVALDGEGLTTK